MWRTLFVKWFYADGDNAKEVSSTDNVIDRNSVRNAEAFKKSRLLFREDSTEIADEAAPWTRNKKT